MNVVMLDELLVVSISVSPAVTVAVFASCPWDEGVTVIVTTALAPNARLPRLHVTVVVPLHAPCVAADDTKATPAGITSVTVTLVAAAGPLLVATMRYASGTPTCPGFGDAVFVTARSTLVELTTFSVIDCE